LFPGPGYGGSCFPKDLKALIQTARQYEVSLDVLCAVEEVNRRQKQRLVAKVSEMLRADLPGSLIAVWGLAFKAETDDLRESPAIDLVQGLLAAGARVVAHDPAAIHGARRLFGDRIAYAEHQYDALRGADALVVVTEWLQFRNPDFARMRSLLRRPIIVDGRNLYEPARMRSLGFTYASIGRPAA
jgi:UDPglucose 6-dehydrogenase